MSAPTQDATPPLPLGSKVAAKPKKQPYPFWLGGTSFYTSLLPDLINSGHTIDTHHLHLLGVAATIAASITQ